MDTGLNPLFAFTAGALTILSPCVLPLVPIVLGGAAQRHRLGPFALAAGLVASFSLVGFAVATIGASAGLDAEVVRKVGAILLILVSVPLIFVAVQHAFERLAAPLARWAGARQANLERFGVAGQAGIGALLGLIWSPCVGPTLGAATVLAARGRDLAAVALVMASFGLGAAAILLVLALATRSFLARWRGKLMSAGGKGKIALGLVMGVVGLLILTGSDRMLENLVVSVTPDWLLALTSHF